MKIPRPQFESWKKMQLFLILFFLIVMGHFKEASKQMGDLLASQREVFSSTESATNLQLERWAWRMTTIIIKAV